MLENRLKLIDTKPAFDESRKKEPVDCLEYVLKVLALYIASKDENKQKSATLKIYEQEILRLKGMGGLYLVFKELIGLYKKKTKQGYNVDGRLWHDAAFYLANHFMGFMVIR